MKPRSVLTMVEACLETASMSRITGTVRRACEGYSWLDIPAEVLQRFFQWRDVIRVELRHHVPTVGIPDVASACVSVDHRHVTIFIDAAAHSGS